MLKSGSPLTWKASNGAGLVLYLSNESNTCFTIAKPNTDPDKTVKVTNASDLSQGAYDFAASMQAAEAVSYATETEYNYKIWRYKKHSYNKSKSQLFDWRGCEMGDLTLESAFTSGTYLKIAPGAAA